MCKFDPTKPPQRGGYRSLKKSIYILFFVFAIACLFLHGVENQKNSSRFGVEFTVILDKDIYDMSDFGEPPQIAVWIKISGQKNIRTVGVTRRTAKNIWKGKFECPTSLPIWKSQTDQSKKEPDAFSSATPKNEVFRSIIYLRGEIQLDCYLEVNVSGDFNSAFPYRDSNGMPDPQVNGQPSLLYYGRINTKPGSHVKLELTGRSDQWYPVNNVISDLSGITSAKKLIKKAWVKCFIKK